MSWKVLCVYVLILIPVKSVLKIYMDQNSISCPFLEKIDLKKNDGMVNCINIGKKENPGYLTNVIYVKSFVGPVLFKLMSDVVKFF